MWTSSPLVCTAAQKCVNRCVCGVDQRRREEAAPIIWAVDLPGFICSIFRPIGRSGSWWRISLKPLPSLVASDLKRIVLSTDHIGRYFYTYPDFLPRSVVSWGRWGDTSVSLLRSKRGQSGTKKSDLSTSTDRFVSTEDVLEQARTQLWAFWFLWGLTKLASVVGSDSILSSLKSSKKFPLFTIFKASSSPFWKFCIRHMQSELHLQSNISDLHLV